MIIEQIKKFPENRNSSFPGSYSSLLIGLLSKTINFMLEMLDKLLAGPFVFSNIKYGLMCL